MSDIDSLLKIIPIDQVASALGVDHATAKAAVETAVPTILAGLHHEASTEAGAGKLAQAVSNKDTSILDGISLDQIDLNDGEKILGHIFGSNTGDVTSAVAQQLSGGDVLGSVLGSILSGGHASAPAPAPAPTDAAPNAGSELAKKLLPLLAPIIMAWLAQQATQKGGQVNGGTGGLLQEILGGVLRNAGQSAGSQTSGSVVTDILGQILRSR